jgi:hypothetical protein
MIAVVQVKLFMILHYGNFLLDWFFSVKNVLKLIIMIIIKVTASHEYGLNDMYM